MDRATQFDAETPACRRRDHSSPHLCSKLGDLCTDKTMSSPKWSREHASPSNAADAREDDGWSEDDEGEGEGPDGSRKRKRSDAGRPMSVSCELCKQRKVKIWHSHRSIGTHIEPFNRSNAIAAILRAVGVFATIRHASTRKGRNPA